MKIVVLYGDWIAPCLLIAGCGLLYMSRQWRGSKKWVWQAIATVLNVLAVSWFIAAPGHLRPIQASLNAVNLPAPELEFVRITDRAKGRLAEYKGHVIVLNLWATWCGPCIREMPALDRLHRQMEGRGLVVVAVTDQTMEEVLRFEPLSRMKLIGGQVDPERSSAVLFVGSDVMRPITHVIDRDGVLRETLLGEQSFESLLDATRKYL